MCHEVRGGGDFRPIILFKLGLRERARSMHSKEHTGGSVGEVTKNKMQP